MLFNDAVVTPNIRFDDDTPPGYTDNLPRKITPRSRLPHHHNSHQPVPAAVDPTTAIPADTHTNTKQLPEARKEQEEREALATLARTANMSLGPSPNLLTPNPTPNPKLQQIPNMNPFLKVSVDENPASISSEPQPTQQQQQLQPRGGQGPPSFQVQSQQQPPLQQPPLQQPKPMPQQPGMPSASAGAVPAKKAEDSDNARKKSSPAPQSSGLVGTVSQYIW